MIDCSFMYSTDITSNFTLACVCLQHSRERTDQHLWAQADCARAWDCGIWKLIVCRHYIVITTWIALLMLLWTHASTQLPIEHVNRTKVRPGTLGDTLPACSAVKNGDQRVEVKLTSADLPWRTHAWAYFVGIIWWFTVHNNVHCTHTNFYPEVFER